MAHGRVLPSIWRYSRPNNPGRINQPRPQPLIAGTQWQEVSWRQFELMIRHLRTDWLGRRVTWVEGLERQSVSHVADWWFSKEPLMSLTLVATFYFLSFRNVCHTATICDIVWVSSATFPVSALSSTWKICVSTGPWCLQMFTDVSERLHLLWKLCSRHLKTQGYLFQQSILNLPVLLCIFCHLTPRPRVLCESDFLNKTDRL